MRTINADEFIEYLIYHSRPDDMYHLGELRNMVEYLAVKRNVAPVTHGQWLKDGDFLICLNCESEINVKNSLGNENKRNYCPCCGAQMKEWIRKRREEK